MSSETQYYQAKVFLKAYSQALQTLDDVHRNNALLAKNLSYRNLLLSGNNKGQISIKNGLVNKQKNFDSSYIKTLGNFTSKSFAKDFAKFQGVPNFNQLIKMLEQSLQ